MKSKRNEKFSYVTWEEIKKELHNTPEQKEAIQLEVQLIEATIKAREEANLSQKELSEKTGMKQDVIDKIEKMNVSPSVDTLLHLLYSLGYTLKIVPLQKK